MWFTIDNNLAIILGGSQVWFGNGGGSSIVVSELAQRKSAARNAPSWRPAA